MNKEIPSSFLQFEKYRMNFNPNSVVRQRFENLFSKAQRGLEVLKIFHLGDSLNQIDFFAAEVRWKLSAYFGDSHRARGLIFPYYMVGSNNPPDHKCFTNGIWSTSKAGANPDKHTGISGYSVKTGGQACMPHVKGAKPEPLQAFCRVVVRFGSNLQSFSPVPLGVGYILAGVDEFSATYMFVNFQYTLSLEPVMKSHESNNFALYGIELLNSKSKLHYGTAGMNGTDSMTITSATRFSTQLNGIKPHFATVSLGTNDVHSPGSWQAPFKENMTLPVKTIRSSLPDSTLIISTSGDHLLTDGRVNSNLVAVREMLVDIAAEQSCCLWDFYVIMGGRSSINTWRSNGLCAPDRLHLNPSGYRLQESLFFDIRYATQNA